MLPQELRVSDLMTTALITRTEEETIGRAELDMELADVRHIPIVDEHGNVIGIISNRDVFRAFGRDLGKRGGGGAVRVGDIVSRDVITVDRDTPAYEAAELLLDHKIGCLPVIGDDGQLVGLVTETDFLRVALRALRAEPLADAEEAESELGDY
jgi:CBS domain-containing protein